MKKYFNVFFLLLGTSVLSYSQVKGVVKGNDNAPIGGIDVLFVSLQDSSKSWTATTNAQGEYEIEGIKHSTKTLKDFVNQKVGQALSYVVKKSGNVGISVYNIQGEKIKSLGEQYREPGVYSISWDGIDKGGLRAPSGLYLCQIASPGGIEHHKVWLSEYGVSNFSTKSESAKQNELYKQAVNEAQYYRVQLHGPGVDPVQEDSVKVGGGFRNFQMQKNTLWEEYRIIMRHKYNNSRSVFEKTKKGRVAFLGGSITYNGGWRDTVENFLKRKYPQTQFDFIREGIPSVGSAMHTFRYKRDILKRGKVDLLFVESAVNDTSNGKESLQRRRATEGIIRQALLDNPQLDIVQLHFAQDFFYPYVKNGLPIPSVQDYEVSGKYYGISMINLARHVAENYTWAQFGADVHPGVLGSSIYGNSIKTLFNQAWKEPLPTGMKMPLNHYVPSAPVDSFSYFRGNLVSIDSATLVSGWTKHNSWHPAQGATRARFVNVRALEATSQGSTLRFSFKGTAVGIVLAAGYDVGKLEYDIDGVHKGTIDQFTKWSKSLHLPWTIMFENELENKEHTLTLTISNTKNPQSQGFASRIFNFAVH